MARSAANPASILSTEQADALGSGPGDAVIFAGSGNDDIWAGKGAQFIDAGDGDDGIWTGAGDQTVLGGAGHDAICSDDSVTARRSRCSMCRRRASRRIWGST